MEKLCDKGEETSRAVKEKGLQDARDDAEAADQVSNS